MKPSRTLTRIAALGIALASASAMADHNSPWGEGWGNMPNDTHDTRIDTRDDSDAWHDYLDSRDIGGGSVDMTTIDRLTTDRADIARGGPQR